MVTILSLSNEFGKSEIRRAGIHYKIQYVGNSTSANSLKRLRQSAKKSRHSGIHCQFYFAASGLQALGGPRQIFQANFLGHKLLSRQIASAHCFQSLANKARG